MAFGKRQSFKSQSKYVKLATPTPYIPSKAATQVAALPYF
jgi:hypothetical protein